MKRFKRSTQKNKGFSLVEVLVAMTVIALISIPLIRTFVISANYTRDARRLQNATDIAQNVSEYFKVIPLDELKDTFRNDRNISSSVLYDDAATGSGAYIFQNVGGGNLDEEGVPYYEGADGEDFYVTVVLNPADYTDLNNYISPEVGDLFSMDIATAFSQFSKYDNKIIKTLKKTYGTAIPEDIGYDDIKKTIYVNLDQSQNPENPNKIDYSYSITVRYTYAEKVGEVYKTDSTTYIEYNFLLREDTLDSCGTGLPDLYLLYPPYDVNDTSYYGNFARDEIIINYRNGEVRESWEEKIDVYIIQQNIPSTHNGLDANKIYLKSNISEMGLAVAKDDVEPNIDIYANVIGWPSEKKVTAGSASMVNLYKMDVYVWYGEKDSNSVDAYIDNDFESDSHYTLITTIKEE